MRQIDPSGEPDLWIPGRLPGLNEALAAAKSGARERNAYGRLKRSWTDAIVLAIRDAKLRSLDCPVYLHFLWVEPNRRRDPDNVAAAKKFVLDGLVQAGVLPNDGWGQIAGWADTWTVGDEPGVKVWVDPV